MRYFLTALLLIAECVGSLRAQVAADRVTFIYVSGPTAVQLPRCPVGCEIRQFRRLATFLSSSPAKDAKLKRNWLTFFSYSGIDFPKGGFVVYDPETLVCTVAATPGELDIIESWYHGCVRQ